MCNIWQMKLFSYAPRSFSSVFRKILRVSETSDKWNFWKVGPLFLTLWRWPQSLFGINALHWKTLKMDYHVVTRHVNLTFLSKLFHMGKKKQKTMASLTQSDIILHYIISTIILKKKDPFLYPEIWQIWFLLSIWWWIR